MKLGRVSLGKRIQHERSSQDTSFDNCKISPPTLSFSPYQVSNKKARAYIQVQNTYICTYVQMYAVLKARLGTLVALFALRMTKASS